jgi:hypothetical protein
MLNMRRTTQENTRRSRIGINRMCIAEHLQWFASNCSSSNIMESEAASDELIYHVGRESHALMASQPRSIVAFQPEAEARFPRTAAHVAHLFCPRSRQNVIQGTFCSLKWLFFRIDSRSEPQVQPTVAFSRSSASAALALNAGLYLHWLADIFCLLAPSTGRHFRRQVLP